MSKQSRFGICILLAAGLYFIGAGSYIHAKAWLAQELIASSWSRTLQGEGSVRPWPWADTWPIARLRIASKNVDLYVLADASGRSLAFGPGHVSGSAPLGGRGLSLVAGHRDTHFAFTQALGRGAVLSLQTLAGVRNYQVFDTLIFDSRNQKVEVEAAAALILVTCYPFDSIVPGGPLRYAVIALPIESAR